MTFSFLLLGTHPELVYLHNELSRREAKRKDLASRQRAYDAACISRKRKMDEDYIWGWWKVCNNLVNFRFHLIQFWLVCEGRAAD